LHFGASVFAENAGFSRGALKIMIYMTILFTASVAFLDSPSKISGILKIYLIAFAWMGIQGIPSGKIWWHPLLANEDSYGPMMVISIAFSYFFGLATSSRTWRWIAWGILLLSVLGLMCSFARGAALAGIAVIGYIIMCSPHKLRMLGGLLIAGIIVVAVAATMFPLDAYIEEIKSSAEGDSLRMTLWGLAWQVFLHSPIYGVGAVNFGVVAGQIASDDMLRGVVNGPENLYFWAVHNVTMQILAEEGIIGITVWIVMIVGFFLRMRRLRRSEAVALWKSRGGVELDLRMLVLGLEGAMIGYLASSLFYNQIYIHWFWSLITIGYVLAGLVSPSNQSPSATRVSHAGVSRVVG